MPEEVRIVGGEHFAEVGRRFAAAGNDLGDELEAGLRAAGRKIIPATQAEARSILPRAGGLADRVAGQRFTVNASASGVTITGSGMKSLAAIDRGDLLHRVFGQDVWVQQSVTPGFFSKPASASVPRVRGEIEHVMSDVAKKIERPL